MNVGKRIALIIKEVGTTNDLALLLGVSSSYVRHWKAETKPVPPKLVNKLVDLSNGKFKPRDLRPDIFR